jgi:putative endonuclease
MKHSKSVPLGPARNLAVERQAARSATAMRAENIAAAHLSTLGLEILGRNVRMGRLEIDIVCRDVDVIVIVEVRTRGRGSWGGPLASVNAKKQRHIRHAGERLWRSRFRQWPEIERMRFDIAAVYLEEGAPRVEIVRAAF